MPYQKLGYTTRQEGTYIPDLAQKVEQTLGKDLESEVGDALKQLGSDKTNLDGFILPDLLRMKSSAFEPGSDVHKALIVLTMKILNHAGFMKTDVDRVAYVDNPLLTAEQAVGNMLTTKIPWLTKSDFGGDRTTLNTLKSILPILIREFATINRLRGDYYTWLRLKLGDIGDKMLHGTPIDQWEKSFFLAYCNPEPGTPGAALGLTGKGKGTGFIPANPISNPLAIDAWELFKKSTQPGPGINYYRLISNQNFEGLVFYYGPHAPSLPISIGYWYTYGPFKNLQLTKLDEKTWSDKDILAGIRDRFVDIPSTIDNIHKAMSEAKESEDTRSLNVSQFTWQMTAPVKICGPKRLPCANAFFDLPDVRLRLRDQKDISKFIWEYYSSWRQRMMLSVAGGNADTLYVDIAVKNATQGQGLIDQLNLESYSLIDPEPSVEKRLISRENVDIVETIWYVKNGRLTRDAVNMTDLYKRRGSIMYRPAFAEYLAPPRDWYYQEDTAATEYISAVLGLSRDETTRNHLPITLSHNDEMFKRLTLNDAPFNVETVIKSTLNIK